MEMLHGRAEKKWKEGKKGEKEEKRTWEKEREREEKEASRKTACTLPETGPSDFKLQASILSELIVAKV